MKLLVTFTIFTMTIISSCIEKDQYIYGGYDLSSESYKEKFVILYKEPDTVNINLLGYKYDCKYVKYINYWNHNESICISYEGIVISPYVFKDETKFDSKYILIVQQPFAKNDSFSDKYPYPQYTDQKYQEFSDVKIWYWIINKIDDIIYGPFTKEMYLEKRVEIGVPDSLRLRIEVEEKK